MKFTLDSFGTGCEHAAPPSLTMCGVGPHTSLLGAFGGMEHRDLADVRFAEVHADAVRPARAGRPTSVGSIEPLGIR